MNSRKRIIGAQTNFRFLSRQTLQTSAPANSAVSQNSGTQSIPYSYSGRRRLQIRATQSLCDVIICLPSEENEADMTQLLTGSVASKVPLRASHIFASPFWLAV